MRRALLTAGSIPPITIGNPGAFGTSALNQSFMVDLSGPASGTGVLTKIKMQSGAGAAFTAVIGSVSGSNFTAKVVAGTFVVSVGLNEVDVSLAVDEGDYLGLYVTNTGLLRYGSDASSLVGWRNQTSTPVVAGVYGLSTFAGRASIFGTG